MYEEQRLKVNEKMAYTESVFTKIAKLHNLGRML
jgi:hypothetical protein